MFDPEGQRGAEDRDAVVERLVDGMVAEAVADIDKPHVLVSFEPVSGTTFITGPYVNALEALGAADRERVSDEVEFAGAAPRTHVVMRLLVPL